MNSSRFSCLPANGQFCVRGVCELNNSTKPPRGCSGQPIIKLFWRRTQPNRILISKFDLYHERKQFFPEFSFFDSLPNMEKRVQALKPNY